MIWLSLSDPRLELRGLPWYAENAPEVWRLPKRAQPTAPKGAWARALVPDGARIRLSCDTARLWLRAQAIGDAKRGCFFDVFVNGESAGATDAAVSKTAELALFDRPERAMRDITIYLPNTRQVRVEAVGVDAGARFQTPPPFALTRPLVCYGSSVLQGTGAAHPAMTYPAILARRLNLDFVNLGFGGSGKAEPQIVALVSELDGCGYLFDLGKSYGDQPGDAYAAMLDTIRASHPDAPVFCVTPIYSMREATEEAYKEKSERLRSLMREAAAARANAGDKGMFVVEGLDLFGPRDEDAFNDPTHPNDQGNARLAQRLAPIVGQALFGKGAP